MDGDKSPAASSTESFLLQTILEKNSLLRTVQSLRRPTNAKDDKKWPSPRNHIPFLHPSTHQSKRPHPRHTNSNDNDHHHPHSGPPQPFSCLHQSALYICHVFASRTLLQPQDPNRHQEPCNRHIQDPDNRTTFYAPPSERNLCQFSLRTRGETLETQPIPTLPFGPSQIRLKFSQHKR